MNRFMWKWLLTRDRMFCVICHQATGQWVRLWQPEMGLVADALRNGKMRRAFRSHVKAEHAGWMERIKW